ncbi:flagellar basal body P-ring protein FlgI [Blastopirellula retiformator]|uniref:Flagellar P-ring protein n=1 Tax=Blastopirellula retiformator TaxID=2527970 RepID=A0A5C5V432_9BACT|nr:flagellar basal body P-ring protein FlgI [Blastopirellula retiformator]TWT33326.1 Flagellar P-ring protein precursor [Blastopirellula retiformator]
MIASAMKPVRLLSLVVVAAFAAVAHAQPQTQPPVAPPQPLVAERFQITQPLSTFVRVKGQEENFLQGIGLVVGLKGTGDKQLTPTHKALSLVLKHLGSNSGSGPEGEYLPEALKTVTNTALVIVQARVPAEGADEGDMIDCEVSSLGAKSLEGGSLAISTLQGPNPHDKTVWAMASGNLETFSKAVPTNARISSGCRIERSIRNTFVSKDNKVYLVLNDGHKDWQMAQEVVFSISNLLQVGQGSSAGTQIARALDQKTIEVQIPPQYQSDPVFFVSILMDTPIVDKQLNNKVVINKARGVIVVGSDVEIGPDVVTHNGIKIETIDPESNKFVPVNTQPAYATRLKDLVDALNTLKVPAEDVIDIIVAIHAQGKLYGELVFVN